MDSKILEILVRHQLTATPALLGAMREVYMAGVMSVVPNEGEDDVDVEDNKSAVLSIQDMGALRAMGVDPHKKFILRNSEFTICGYKPNRWKFPIIARTQNGTRYKFTAANVKQYQQKK